MGTRQRGPGRNVLKQTKDKLSFFTYVLNQIHPHHSPPSPYYSVHSMRHKSLPYPHSVYTDSDSQWWWRSNLSSPWAMCCGAHAHGQSCLLIGQQFCTLATQLVATLDLQIQTITSFHPPPPSFLTSAWNLTQTFPFSLTRHALFTPPPLSHPSD